MLSANANKCVVCTPVAILARSRPVVGRRTAAITLFSDRHLGGGALLLSVALLARSDVACCELCPWQRPDQDRQRVLPAAGLADGPDDDRVRRDIRRLKRSGAF